MMALNWIDLLLGALILLGILLGWRRGFLLEFIDLATWVAGLLSGIRFYELGAQWLMQLTGWPIAWCRPISFFIIFLLGMSLLRWLAGKIIVRVPPKAHQHFANKLLGSLPGLANGLIYAVIVATLLMAFPLPQWVQHQASDSTLNNRLAGYAEVAESKLQPVFNEAINQTLNTLTVRPQSKEMVKLPFTPDKV